MCDSMTPYFANTPNTLPPYLGGGGPNHHDQYNNGDIQHHIMGSCHENGRGPPIGAPQLLPYSHQHTHHQPIHYANHQPYPRFPPYDRIDVKHCADGASQQADTSPYYSCPSNGPPPPTSQGPPPPPPLAALQQQPTAQYDCSGRGSITPPSLDGSNGQYGNCKMQPSLVSHNDSMTPIGPNSPSPHHVQHQIYGSGPVGSPNQNSNSALPSPIYPWMRSQFGKWLCLHST